jgi:hypothetical protein
MPVPGHRVVARAPGLPSVRAGYGTLSGPLALITWEKATGSLLGTRLPPGFAPMAPEVGMSWKY